MWSEVTSFHVIDKLSKYAKQCFADSLNKPLLPAKQVTNMPDFLFWPIICQYGNPDRQDVLKNGAPYRGPYRGVL